MRIMKRDWAKKVNRVIKKILQFCLNPRLLLCFGIAWIITNGWCYAFIALGAALEITWMTVAGASYAVFIWAPFTPEKIVTLAITVFLLRLLFPKDEKTLRVLKEELAALKRALKNAAAKRRRKHRVRKLAKRIAKQNRKM